MAVIPETHADLLDKKAFWYIATMGPDDEIQSSPVWVGWDGEHFMFSLTRGRQKYENLVCNPTIAVSATDPDNHDRTLEIRGTVVRVDDDSSNAFIDSMVKKYMGVDEYPMHQPGGHRVETVVMSAHTTKMDSDEGLRRQRRATIVRSREEPALRRRKHLTRCARPGCGDRLSRSVIAATDREVAERGQVRVRSRRRVASRPAMPVGLRRLRV